MLISQTKLALPKPRPTWCLPRSYCIQRDLFKGYVSKICHWRPAPPVALRTQNAEPDAFNGLPNINNISINSMLCQSQIMLKLHAEVVPNARFACAPAGASRSRRDQ